ncbi:hypothetical protein PINS_up006416 [Pythium insidiosum]|nr:hypothetical protein PINS_up006416 [Pythium insidiosum]
MRHELPAIGTRGVRLLDALRFPCVVTAIEEDVLTVRYDEDGSTELGVEPHEFERLDTDGASKPSSMHEGTRRDRLLDMIPTPHANEGNQE